MYDRVVLPRALIATLRTHWRESGLSAAQIAARAGCHENTVFRIFGGHNTRAESLLDVCRVIGIQTIPTDTPEP